MWLEVNVAERLAIVSWTAIADRAMAAAALTGKSRNDWMRRTQAFLALQAYGDLVRNFPDKYDAQTTEMKEIYDTLVAKIDVPVGLDRGHLLVQWQGTNKTEMSGGQLIT